MHWSLEAANWASWISSFMVWATILGFDQRHTMNYSRLGEWGRNKLALDEDDSHQWWTIHTNGGRGWLTWLETDLDARCRSRHEKVETHLTKTLTLSNTLLTPSNALQNFSWHQDSQWIFHGKDQSHFWWTPGLGKMIIKSSLQILSTSCVSCMPPWQIEFWAMKFGISKTWFSHVDRHSSSPDIIVSHSYMPSLARCPSTPQHPTVLCECKLILCSSTETWVVTIGCYRGASTFYPALIGC